MKSVTEADVAQSTIEALPMRDVAKIAHVSRTALGRWARSGLLRATKTPAGWRVLRSDLEAFLRSGERR